MWEKSARRVLFCLRAAECPRGAKSCRVHGGGCAAAAVITSDSSRCKQFANQATRVACLHMLFIFVIHVSMSKDVLMLIAK